MLNQKLKLNTKIFGQDVEQIPIRNGFGEGLVIAGDSDKNVVGLCADLTESTKMEAFAKKYPERFVEIGVAEQNLATVASGMSAMGKIPFISSYAMFSPGRNWEQIRTTIAYNDRSVVVVGSHSGISVGPDGGTHQAIEDLALMRVVPNMVVISPCDSIEAKKATIALAKLGKPVYLRLAREKTPVITTEETPFEIGKANVIFESEKKLDVVVFSTGSILYKALFAVEELIHEGVSAVLINISSLKPLDTDTILEYSKKAGAVVTVEEHQIIGGLGGAISEFLSQNFPVPVEFVGIKDQFGQSGTPEELIEHYQMNTSHIKEAVKKVMKRK